MYKHLFALNVKPFYHKLHTNVLIGHSTNMSLYWYKYMEKILWELMLSNFQIAFYLGVRTSLHAKPFICVLPTGSFSYESKSYYVKGFAHWIVLKQGH